jgi:hypothetical protein
MKVSMLFKVKRFLARVALLALGVSFELLSKLDPGMKAEVADWEEGRLLTLGVLPEGPSIAVKKVNGQLKYLGQGEHGAELKIYFKNAESALVALLGIIGAHTAFAEHRAIVHGSIGEAMEANRAMAIVVKYLFPGILLKRITKRTPKMGLTGYAVYAVFMIILVPALIINAAK